MIRVLFILLLAAGCGSRLDQQPLSTQVAIMHGAPSWRSHKALSGDIHIQRAGKPPLDARFIHETATGRTRMQLTDGAGDDPLGSTFVLLDGPRAWSWPAASPARHDHPMLRIWPSILAAPFNMDDPATNFTPDEPRKLGQTEYLTARVTWSRRRAPQESHLAYIDPRTRLLIGIMGDVYPAQQDSEPLAVTFYKFEELDGVVMATEWRFWKWNKEAGIHGLPVGEGKLYNLEFVKPGPNTFTPARGAREIVE